MFAGFDIKEELQKKKVKSTLPEDEVIAEVNRILSQSVYKEKNILRNLKTYNKSFQLLNEEGLEESLVFKPQELKDVCIKLRLKFLDSQNYQFDVPYAAILKIKELMLNLQQLNLLYSKLSYMLQPDSQQNQILLNNFE